MLDSTEFASVALGTWGFYARTIAKALKDYHGESLKTHQVYRVLRKHGVKLREYREGITPQAKDAIEALSVREDPRVVGVTVRPNTQPSKSKRGRR